MLYLCEYTKGDGELVEEGWKYYYGRDNADVPAESSTTREKDTEDNEENGIIGILFGL